MSNKTSDNNVANIEDDMKLVKRYLENSAYKETDSDFFKNGGWEMVDLEIPKAMANILAEREQEDKRIKELEEESRKKSIELICYQEELENSIPKQVVIEAISVHQDYLLNQATTSNPNLDASFRDRERYAIQVLQELLGGENEN